jgi:hypothetical protein
LNNEASAWLCERALRCKDSYDDSKGVSANTDSPAARGLQADLNAAANIGLKALMDPDWIGAWWYVLADTATGRPDPEKVKGCPIWNDADPALLATAIPAVSGRASKNRQGNRTAVYAFNPFHWHATLSPSSEWLPTQNYWTTAERAVAGFLIARQTEPESPF